MKLIHSLGVNMKSNENEEMTFKIIEEAKIEWKYPLGTVHGNK